MPKKALDLDTPFKRGETVVMARPARNVPDGAEGKIKLINGLETLDGINPWIRYWVRFKDHGLVGQVSHADLARPYQFGDWLDREEARMQAELAAESSAAVADDAPAVAAGDGDAGGVASLIPANLLERSKAAKARLLGS
jgi:hypothetical protein